MIRFEAIRNALPSIPKDDAICHAGIVSQIACHNCQRIVAAHRQLLKIETLLSQMGDLLDDA